MDPLYWCSVWGYFKGNPKKINTYGETQYITGITTGHSYLATEMTKTVVKVTKLFLQCILWYLSMCLFGY